MIRLAAVVVAAIVALAYLFPRLDVRGGGAYSMPLERVNMVIDHTDLPALIFADKAANVKHWRPDQSTSIWAILGERNAELLWLVATTTAEGKKTRVQVQVKAPESEAKELVERGLKEYAAIRELYRAALAEQIDANLNARDFNLKRISAPISRAMVVALPNVKKRFENAAAEYDRRERENIERAYANEK
jgi:hypothetical protein